MRKVTWLIALAAIGGLSAQHSPYVELRSREIKALSAARVKQYQQGAGMSLALAAELNGYPGPKHVLELAERLELSPGQVSETRRIYDAMHGEAVRLGRRIVKEERRLDRAFSAGAIKFEDLERKVAEIGALQGKLRGVHLRAHVSQRKLLTDHQLQHYQKLRGY